MAVIQGGKSEGHVLMPDALGDVSVYEGKSGREKGQLAMCCRYYVDLSPELRPFVEAANRSPLRGKMTARFGRELVTHGEIRPTDLAAVLAPDKAGEANAYPMRWGFPDPRGGASFFNARVETAGIKPIFRESWEKRRCVIPASCYFEWEHPVNPKTGKAGRGDKYRIRPREGSLVWMAGLYRIEKQEDFVYPVFTILTREAAEGIRFIHDRMPVMLSEEDAHSWIRPDAEPEWIMEKTLTDMYFEKDDRSA